MVEPKIVLVWKFTFCMNELSRLKLGRNKYYKKTSYIYI